MQKISLGIGIWLVVLLLACDDTSKKPGVVQDAYVEDMTQEDSLLKEDMKIKDMIIVDMLPMEPNPCETDSQCFEGRICLAGQCAPAECKSSVECPADRPICIGTVDENDQIQRGRCGNCLENTDCYEPATCQPFNEGIKGGVCVSGDSCEGTLDCPPAARNVMRGIQDPVCLDRSTSNQSGICVEPFKCQNDTDCPSGLNCLATGQCAPIAISENCTDSSECGFDEVCRSEGQCGACQLDNECGANQVCQGNLCQEVPGACQEDSHCLGNRHCVLGECIQPECMEDAYGPNATFADVKEIVGDRVYRNLMSCGDDWFKFTLPPEMNVLIAVRQMDRGANLGLVTYDDEQRELARSVGASPLEGVRLRESVAPREIYIKVFQEHALGTAAYQLEISYTPSNDQICLDDPFEIVAPDNDLDHGRLIRASSNDRFPNEVVGQICQGDDDFICFAIGRGETLSIKGVVELGDALIVGTLYQPNGDALMGARQSGRWAADLNPTDIETTLQEEGIYCLGLSVDMQSGTRVGQGRYKLKINAVSPEVASLCGQAEEIALDGRRGGATGTLTGMSSLKLSCANSDGPEKAYYFDVTEPSLLVARVAGIASGTLGAPVVSIRSQCEQSSSELSCSDQSIDFNNPYLSLPSPAILRAPINPPVDPITNQVGGRYTLIVDGVEVGDTPSYQVDLELRPLAPVPVNDRCDRASALNIPNDGVLVFQGNLDQAKDDGAGCIGQNAPDVYYQVTIPQASRVVAQATSIPADFPVAVYLQTICNGGSAQCGFGFDEIVPAGTYLLAVDGVDAQSRGRFEVQLVVTPVPMPSINDTCGNAINLEGRSGQVFGNTQGATDDFQLPRQNTCTRDNTQGGDLVYKLNVQANQRVQLTATPQDGWDLSLYVLNNCDADINSACVVGQDGALAEDLTFTPAQTGVVYIVVDGVNQESGAFDLTWNIQ